MIRAEWEILIDNRHMAVTARLKVIGGWIVNSFVGDDQSHSQSMVFVPDPNYEWTI